MTERARTTSPSATIRASMWLTTIGATGLVPTTALAADAEQTPFAAPPARYEVRLDRSFLVPMRDGARLSTDLYIPEGVAGRLPTILIRTPYDKGRAAKEFRGERRTRSPTFVFPSQGFVVAVQDKRGKYESEGIYVMGGGDVEDADDTIDWIVRQPWSNGKVGMYGCSYLGGIQIKAAQSLNPHFVALLPQASSTAHGGADGRYLNFFWKGGALELEAIIWFHSHGSKYYYHPPPGLSREEFLSIADFHEPAPRPPEVDWPKVLPSLPLIDLDRRAGSPPSDWRDTVTHAPDDPWWTRFGYLSETSKVDVPALFVNSWYDHGVAESLLQFNFFRNRTRSAKARSNQFVIISPTTHCGSEYESTERTVIGDRPLGDARYSFFDAYVRWFDHWLRDGDAAVTRMPPVQYFVMGLGRWKSASAWPVPGTVPTRFYLRSDGHANSRMGSGVLSLTAPDDEPPDDFLYDPATPVPSSAPFSTGHPSFDQRDIEMRADVLVYSTPALEPGIEVTGPSWLWH